MTDDIDIDETVNRLEEIITTLEDGDVALDRAKELHDERQALLEDMQSALELGDGNVIEK